jgi:hypothetical protein
LHILLQANDEEKLLKGQALIEKVLRGEEEEAHKLSSEHQLAVINSLII